MHMENSVMTVMDYVTIMHYLVNVINYPLEIYSFADSRMGLYAFGFLKFYLFFYHLLHMTDHYYPYTNTLQSLMHTTDLSQSPFFDNLTLIYTLLLFML
jgi:hypothetical protein